MRFLHLLIVTLPCLLPVGLWAQEAARHPGDPILVGSELDYPPFALVDAQGEPIGFSIDLIKAAAEAVGLRLQFRTGPWSEMRAALADGAIDALPLVSYSRERDEVFDFTMPHTVAYGAIFIRHGDPEITNEANLRDKRLLVMRADATQDYLAARELGRLIEVETVSEVLRRLASGEADAAVAPRLVGLHIANQLGLDNLTLSGPLLDVYGRGYGFAVQQDDAHLRDLLNEGLSVIQTNGVYDALYQKWFGQFAPSAPNRLSPILRWAAIGGGGVFALTLFVLAWNRTLSRQVRERTRDLEAEIKERRLAQSELHQAHAILAAQQASSPDGILFVGLDRRPLSWNLKFLQLLGLDTIPIAEMTGSEILAATLDNVADPNAFAAGVEALHQNIETEENGVEIQMCDGRVLERNSQPLRNEAGDWWGRIWFYRDITEHKKIEEALRFREHTFRTLVESTHTIPWRLALDSGRFTYMGPQVETLLGFPTESWTDIETWKSRIHPEDREQAFNYCQICTERGEDHDFEYRCIAQDERVIWIRDVVSVMMANGRPSELLGFMFDITDFKRTEMALRRANEASQAASQAKSLFLATMSHEIRTPINAILGMGELLAESRLDPEQRRFLETSNQACESLLALVNDILDLSKIEAGQLDLDRVVFHLPKLIQGTLAILRLQAEKKGIALRNSVEELPGGPWVAGDPGRLRQILLNTVGNAIKFTDQGSVTLDAVRDNDQDLTFRITDTGPGIAINNREMIFEPFHQADASTTRAAGGAGLGLTICQRLISKMGGRIWVEGEAGEGATFAFRIPLPNPTPDSKSPPTPPNDGTASPTSGLGNGAPNPGAANVSAPPLSTTGAARTILLADDSPDNLFLVQAFLKNTPHTLLTAKNGVEAVEIFQNSPVDLVLMDIQMPLMDGFEATRRMRDIERDAARDRTPVIALTAHAMKEIFDTAQGAGCDAFLTKPIKKQRLLEAIHEVAGG